MSKTQLANGFLRLQDLGIVRTGNVIDLLETYDFLNLWVGIYMIILNAVTT